MELSTFAKEKSVDVISDRFKRELRVDGIRFTVELAPFCWLEGKNLAIAVTGSLGEGRFRSPKSFKAARWADLEKLIRRVKNLNSCHGRGCAKKYLVHDDVKKENPRGLCERHRLADILEQRDKHFKKQELQTKALETGGHAAIIQSGGMQDDEKAQDAIAGYAKRIATVIKGRVDLKKLFEDIDDKMGDEDDARAVLGVADYLLKKGVKFNKAARNYVLECVDAELKPNALSNWFNRQKRRKDLIDFRRMVA